MSKLRELAYRLDPVLWVREILQIIPTPWQETFLRSPRGASILALTARQVGKTTVAAWGIAHAMVFSPQSLSVIACPAQRQSAEAVRRVREALLKAGQKLQSDNVYGLELGNGSRVLALPGSDDLIRGLTVDAWIVADEAARLPEDLIAALRPMRARRPQARLAMLSTAWSRSIHSGRRGRATTQASSGSKQQPIVPVRYLHRASSNRSDARSVNPRSSANISAFPAVRRRAHSLGTSTNKRSTSTCRRYHPVQHLHRRRKQHPDRCPIRSSIAILIGGSDDFAAR